jgi:hypothetical protein
MIADGSLRDAVAGMFGDKRFHEISRFVHYGDIDGTKIGCVVATMTQQFVNYALGKDGTDRVHNAKQSGKIDAGFVVMAKVDAMNAYTFIDAFDIVEIYDKLQLIRTRTSERGEYWILSPALVAAGFDAANMPF